MFKEDLKTLKKEMKEDPRQRKDFPHWRVSRINAGKWPLYQSHCIQSGYSAVIPIKILMQFFTEIEKIISKFIQKWRRFAIARIVLSTVEGVPTPDSTE